MWLDFALSSVARGRQVVATMGGRPVFGGRRVIDIGCAYGGFLVAAAEAGAKQVTGIDIDSSLLELARLQLSDYQREADLRLLDVTRPDAPDDVGRFDLVICNDVIEHVDDPAALVRNIAALLVPGGSVYIQIPNGQAVEFMSKDGHYGLFGITLLDRMRAEQWWSTVYGGRYTVGHYAPLGYYLDAFSQAGIAVRLISSPPVDLGGMVDELEGRFLDLEASLSWLTAAPEDVVEEMRRRGQHEIEHFRHLAGLFRQSTVPAEREIIGRTLWSTYQLTFWELIGTKV